MASQALERIISTHSKRQYPKGALIIQEGEISDSLFVLTSGAVRAFSIGVDGREVVFNEYYPIECFGEMSLDGGARSASIIAMEKSECAVISKQELKAFVSLNPDFAFELITLVIKRARQATASARNMALLDVYGRLKAFLDDVPSRQIGSDRELARRYTHGDIAKRIGASREMISKLLKDLEIGGYLRTDGEYWKLRQLPSKW